MGRHSRARGVGRPAWAVTPIINPPMRFICSMESRTVGNVSATIGLAQVNFLGWLNVAHILVGIVPKVGRPFLAIKAKEEKGMALTPSIACGCM